MSNPIQILAEHAASTLPDSIVARKRLLRAIQNCLTDSHPGMKNVRKQLALLESMGTLQEELPLKFPAVKPSHPHDGKHDGKHNGHK
jgi:hypothetical protein